MKIMMVLMALMMSFTTLAAEKQKQFTLLVSNYVGWEPFLAADQSIVAKWAKKYNIQITVTRIGDYVESLNQFSNNEKIHGVVVANVDLIGIVATAINAKNPAEVLIINDYSNGNDAIVSREVKTLKELKGKSVELAQFTVSHYMLARALSMQNPPIKEKDLTLTNISDSEAESLFLSNPRSNMVSWNPMVLGMKKAKNATVLFNSSQLPGEVLDLTVVKENADPAFKKALAGAWHEIQTTLANKTNPNRKALVERMGKGLNNSPESVEEQLSTTAMYSSKDGAAFSKGEQVVKTMDFVRKFAFEQGLAGKKLDEIGISFDSGKTLGNPKNIKVKFNSTYMQAAADGKL